LKSYSPALIQCLSDALLASFWYKGDLRSFLLRAGIPETVVARLDWSRDSPKRATLRALFDRLATQPDRGTAVISKLMDSVVEQDTFEHLQRLDDGKRKVDDARRAVELLKDKIGARSVVERAERARGEQRTASAQRQAALVARQQDSQALQNEFENLAMMRGEQARGLAFEPFLRRLFTLHDLDPRGSYTVPGEQIDGSIRLDSTLFLIEARWRSAAATPADIGAFKAKIVEGKLNNTLGIFISMNGFTEEAIRHAGLGERVVILVEGVDLTPAIQGHVDLVEMLRRKVRSAGEAGQFLARV